MFDHFDQMIVNLEYLIKQEKVTNELVNTFIGLFCSDTGSSKPKQQPTRTKTMKNTFKRKCDNCHQVHNALFAKLCRMHEVFILEDLTDVIWALSKSSSSSFNQSSILTKIAARINSDVQPQSAASLINLLLTCCESNVHMEDLFYQDSAFMTACLEKKDEYKDEELRTLYKFHAWQQELDCVGLPSELHERCFEAHLLPSNLLSGYD